jgi:hypothetical protein
LAYSSTEEGRLEVYVRPLAGSGGRLKVSTEGGTQPVWSHGGTELTYLALAGLGTPQFAPFLERVMIRAEGSALRVEARDEPFTPWTYTFGWTGHAQWDLTPDAQGVIAFGRPGEASDEYEGRYVVVQNFDEELRRLMPE